MQRDRSMKFFGGWIMGQGWIKLHRKLRDCDLWNCEPFSRGQAWVDILLMVNHDDKKVVLGSQVKVVKRGQTITSIRKLSDKWQWGNKKTLAFLGQLEELDMIHRESDTKKTLLTVINYDDYQLVGNTKEYTKGNTNDNTNDHTDNTQTINKRNIKNKKENNMSKKEHQNEVDKLFESVWNLYIRKEGKTSVTKAAKEEIFKVGYDKMKTCIEKYAKEKQNTEKKYILMGSTFFNGRYKDYLPPEIQEKLIEPTKTENVINVSEMSDEEWEKYVQSEEWEDN